jgi:hypothetical protein
MKRSVAVLIFVSLFANGALWAAKGPEIGLIDNKLSVSAESVSLGRLLQLIDLATGMKSKVPPELANRNISVRFSGLNINDGVRKLFQGQPLDYVLIEGQGIVVTAASQNISGAEPVPTYNSQPQQIEQPFVQDFPGQPIPGQQQGAPATIMTPFGPNPNPRAQLPQQNQPVVAPQQNSLFPQPAQQNQPANQQAPVYPGIQPTSPNPFGAPSPFGTPNPANQNPNQNNVFGTPNPANNQNPNQNNVFAPVFGTPGTQQR